MTNQSGTVGIRQDLPRDLHTALKVYAAQNGLTMKETVELALIRFVWGDGDGG